MSSTTWPTSFAETDRFEMVPSACSAGEFGRLAGLTSDLADGEREFIGRCGSGDDSVGGAIHFAHDLSGPIGRSVGGVRHVIGGRLQLPDGSSYTADHLADRGLEGLRKVEQRLFLLRTSLFTLALQVGAFGKLQLGAFCFLLLRDFELPRRASE